MACVANAFAFCRNLVTEYANTPFHKHIEHKVNYVKGML